MEWIDEIVGIENDEIIEIISKEANETDTDLAELCFVQTMSISI